MKRLFIFVFAFSLMLLSAAAAETGTADSGYVPARENIYGLYQDFGPHSSQITVTIPDGSELDFESFFSGGQMQSLEVEIEKDDGTEYEVVFDGDKKSSARNMRRMTAKSILTEPAGMMKTERRSPGRTCHSCGGIWITRPLTASGTIITP